VQDPSNGSSAGWPRVSQLAVSFFLGPVAFSSKVAHLPAVEAWKVAGGELLWRPDGSLLWWWGSSMVVVAVEIATVGIVGDCPNSAAVVVDTTDSQVGYTPCGTWVEHH
jgi:hypothetical protein